MAQHFTHGRVPDATADNSADDPALKCAAVRRWIAQLGSFARVVDGVVSRPVRSAARGGWSACRFASFRRIAASSH